MEDWTGDLMSYGDPRFQHDPQGKGVSKEPQLAEDMITDNENIYDRFYGKIITNNTISSWQIEKWRFFSSFDNFEAITLKFKPELWTSKLYINNKIADYCKKRLIDYYYVFENEQTNLHFHGLFGFPSGPVRKAFQVWVNKYLGKLHQSPKGDSDVWFVYCHFDIWHMAPLEIRRELDHVYTMLRDRYGATNIFPYFDVI